MARPWGFGVASTTSSAESGRQSAERPVSSPPRSMASSCLRQHFAWITSKAARASIFGRRRPGWGGGRGRTGGELSILERGRTGWSVCVWGRRPGMEGAGRGGVQRMSEVRV
eukprot:scaffold8583_cov119-Isochrysis_galbana.AAC.6